MSLKRFAVTVGIGLLSTSEGLWKGRHYCYLLMAVEASGIILEKLSWCQTGIWNEVYMSICEAWRRIDKRPAI